MDTSLINTAPLVVPKSKPLLDDQIQELFKEYGNVDGIRETH
jgi:hypothetical protein